MSDGKVLASAASATSYTMAIQLTFRLLTFVLNSIMVRYISRDLLGVVNVRLPLLYTTILFLTNEAFYRACLSSKRTNCWPQIVNVVWLTVPLGAFYAVLFGVVWTQYLERPDPQVVQNYDLAVFCFCLSAVLETLMQPLFVIGQIMLFVKIKAIIDGICLAVRCTVTAILVVNYPHWGIIPFFVMQLVYSALMASLYYIYFVYYVCYVHPPPDFPFQSVRDFFPKMIPDKPFIDSELAGLILSFFKQSLLKQMLTEGERYVMTFFRVLSFADQGVYDVINNLGSLAARFIFLPIEDGFYLFTTQTLHRGAIAKNQSSESMDLVSRVFESLLRIVVLIGVTIVTFGYGYSHLLLDMYGGATISTGSGPTLLRWYCAYVLLIAVNGVTEGFKNATMNQSQVDGYNRKMCWFTAIFLVSSLLLTYPFGSIGFILANCLNMISRIVHSVRYIRSFYQNTAFNPLNGCHLSVKIILSYVMAFVVVGASEAMLCCSHGWLLRIVHIFIGALTLILICFMIWQTEKTLFEFVRKQYSMVHSERSEKLKSS